MPPTNLSQTDREAIQDVLHRYIWCMDTGNIAGIVETFTRDGTVKDVTGHLWDGSDAPRNFATHFISQPNGSVGQHWVQHMSFEDAPGGGCVVTSYWFTAHLSADGPPVLSRLGRYVDTCVKVDGRWLIEEKRIDPWNDETVELVGRKA